MFVVVYPVLRARVTWRCLCSMADVIAPRSQSTSTRLSIYLTGTVRKVKFAVERVHVSERDFSTTCTLNHAAFSSFSSESSSTQVQATR